jgi:hypothetical protein
MLSDLIVERDPPEKRRKYCEGNKEHCLPEAAVMLAFTMHLLKSEPGVRRVNMYPDGMHGKGFKIREWLERQGFTHSGGSGRSTYAGEYRMKDKVVTQTGIRRRHRKRQRIYNRGRVQRELY